MSTLRVIEAGTPEAPRLGALYRLARVLDVPVHDLLHDDAERPAATPRPPASRARP